MAVYEQRPQMQYGRVVVSCYDRMHGTQAHVHTQVQGQATPLELQLLLQRASMQVHSSRLTLQHSRPGKSLVHVGRKGGGVDQLPPGREGSSTAA